MGTGPFDRIAAFLIVDYPKTAGLKGNLDQLSIHKF
jgi:hypothetical protein